MINSCDLIIDFVEENGWDVVDRYDISDHLIMFWVQRPSEHEIWSLNVLLDRNEVKVLNRFKPKGYVEAQVNLCDPSSLDSLEKVFQ